MVRSWNARSEELLEAGIVGHALRGSEPQSLMVHTAAVAGALWLARSGCGPGIDSSQPEWT